LHFRKLNKKDTEILTSDCNCSQITTEEITKVVDDVLEYTGKEPEKVIMILQEVQKRLNYLPSEALKHICSMTAITPGQISGVSSFYSQFRHMPVGEHTIRICSGTACHVKGAPLIAEAFKRLLKIDASRNSSPDNLFSIEEVACLGCCTLAPVVQIDGKTYGHVKPTQTEEIIKNFLETRITSNELLKEEYREDVDAEIRIGIGSCCVAGGSKEILSEIIEIKNKYDLNIRLKAVGCVGVCNQTPLLEIVKRDNTRSRYTNVKTLQVEEILLKHIKPKTLKNRIKHSIYDLADTFLSDDKLKSRVNIAGEIREKYIINFLKSQVHITTANSGILNPESIEEYCLFDGFQAFLSCIKINDQESIVNNITLSGLRGRGGAGFPTGLKWNIFRKSDADVKYVVCNGDEGDPGAFMDRMLLESFPYRVIEGMLIAGFATGATEGIFYIRAEYPLAVTRVRNALKQCYSKGYLGEKIASSGFTFNIRIFEGAGAFVCGEETALIASLEGKRGTPGLRPPYPAVKGYLGKPTLVNNVETLATIPWIINNGAESFRLIGTEKSSGTKVFALAGKISKGGLIEVPMGISISEIVEKIGDGVVEGRTFKAVQIGGPSGGCIPASLESTSIDFDELNSLGAMMGSGGMIVLDNTDCMVDMAKYFLTFTHKQSCGKCTFCRIGTKKMLDIIIMLSEGKAELTDLDILENLCQTVKNGSLCGLGKTSPNPVITGLRYFREEYEEHTLGFCRAQKCRDLIRYNITDKCTGCTKCSQECPVKAIAFKPYEKHEIDQSLCTKCDNCRIICPVSAIEIIQQEIPKYST
jgi:NADH-quinone oxidoreductase subunit F